MAKQKYSINWEDDIPVSFEVDGIQYESVEDIADDDDRLKLETMMDAAEDAEFEKRNAAKPGSCNRKDHPADLHGRGHTDVADCQPCLHQQHPQDQPEESAPGQVVEEFYYPVVQFVASDGRRCDVKMSEGSSSPSCEVGDEVVVLYEPDHPKEARIKSFSSYALTWIPPSITGFITGIIGIGFLVAVLAVIKVMSSETQGTTIKNATN